MCPSTTMRNPYESYIQTLLPLMVKAAAESVGDSADGEAAAAAVSEPLTKVTISICSDNARPLAEDASMTMKLLKPKVSAVNRWSSVPDLQGFAFTSLSAKKGSSNSRSIDDLRNLMTNNSRRPKSTDNLRAALSTSALARRQSPTTSNSPPSRGNDRWESKASSQKKNLFDLGMPGLPVPSNGRGNDRWQSKASRSSTKQNPFDLRMPGLTLSGAASARRAMARSHTMPSAKLGGQSLRLPQRTTSMEAVRRDVEPGLPARIDEEPSEEASPSHKSKLLDLTPMRDESGHKESKLLDLAPLALSRAA